MSILQEYEQIRKSIGENEYNHIVEFLKLHDNYYLSDIYCNQSNYNQFKQWEKIKYE